MCVKWFSVHQQITFISPSVISILSLTSREANGHDDLCLGGGEGGTWGVIELAPGVQLPLGEWEIQRHPIMVKHTHMYQEVYCYTDNLICFDKILAFTAHSRYHSCHSQGQIQAGCRGRASIAGSTLPVCGTGAQGLEQTREITGKVKDKWWRHTVIQWLCPIVFLYRVGIPN